MRMHFKWFKGAKDTKSLTLRIFGLSSFKALGRFLIENKISKKCLFSIGNPSIEKNPREFSKIRPAPSNLE